MADPVLTRKQLRAARERLMDRGVADKSLPPFSLGVRPAIERSWRRSVTHHVAADASAARFVNVIDPASPLLVAAVPVIEHWQDSLAGMRVAIFLSDRDGQIVARRGDRADLRRFDRASAAEGFDFSESSLGTNGLGTAIEDRGPVFVRGGEHFSATLEPLACAGVPIRCPGTGRVIGSLAFATAAETASPLMLAMARQAAAQIEQRIAQTAMPAGVAAIAAALAGGRRATRPVLVLSEQGVIANTLALGFVAPEMHAQLWEQLETLDWSRTCDAVVRLPGSEHEAVARPMGSGFGGMAYGLWPRPRPRTGSGPAVAASPDRTVPAPAELESLSRTSGAVTLAGPAGAGKHHLAQDWLGSRPGAQPPLTVDAADPPAADSGGWQHAAAEAISAGRSVIIRHAEALLPAEASRLHAVARRARAAGDAAEGSGCRAAPRLALTVDDTLAPPAVIARLARMAPLVTVPALRATRERIPGLVTSMLARHPVADRVVLSPAVIQAFLRWDWPGNIGELRAVLDQLAVSHAGRIAGLDDLPPRLRTPARVLSGIESAECDAIVAALRRADGNRAAAARELGIGRTTLYRKMRAYRIGTGTVAAAGGSASRLAAPGQFGLA